MDQQANMDRRECSRESRAIGRAASLNARRSAGNGLPLLLHGEEPESAIRTLTSESAGNRLADMSRKVHIAAVQPLAAGPATSHDRMVQSGLTLLRAAAESGADIVCLPEYFNVMGINAAAAHEVIESTGTQVELARRICEERSVWLLLPLIEKRGERRYNCAHLFDPGGNVVHTYDKTHLTISETRDYELTPGEDITTVDTSLCRIGVMICYDIYFPEVARVLALQGVQLILFPSLQRSDVEASTMLFNRVRAMDAQSYLVRSSFGQPRGSAYKPGMMYGGSCVIAPDGSILASADSNSVTGSTSLNSRNAAC